MVARRAASANYQTLRLRYVLMTLHLDMHSQLITKVARGSHKTARRKKKKKEEEISRVREEAVW